MLRAVAGWLRALLVYLVVLPLLPLVTQDELLKASTQALNDKKAALDAVLLRVKQLEGMKVSQPGAD